MMTMKELHDKLGHPPLKILKEMIANDNILSDSMEIETNGIEKDEIKDCITCKSSKGATMKIRGKSMPTSDSFGKIIYGDIVFIKTQPYVYLTEHKTSLRFIQEVAVKDKENLKIAIKNGINYFESYMDENVRDIYWDNERVLNAIGKVIEKAHMHHWPQNYHERHSEASTRTLRNKIKSVLISLPYEASDLIIKKSIIEAVKLMNITPNVKTGGESSINAACEHAYKHKYYSLTEDDLNPSFGEIG